MSKGIFSTLGTIGGLALAPFTGGASTWLGPLLGGIGDVSSTLGKQEQGEANGRVTQAELNQRQDQNAIANYIAQQNAQTSAANTDLSRKQFESNNRSTTAKQALIGALLGGGVTPTSISPQGASGGLLRSLNANPDALNALKTLGTQGATAQASPLQFQGGLMVKPPELTPMQPVNNNGFLSTLAKIGQLVGAASPYLPKPSAQPEMNPEQMAAIQNPNIYGNVRF